MTRKRFSRSERRRRRKQRPREQQRQQGAAAVLAENDLDEDECAICLEGSECGPLITPCACADARYYHYQCVSRWIIARRDQPCRVCGERYTDPRIRRTVRTFSDFFRQNYFLLPIFVINIILLIGAGAFIIQDQLRVPNLEYAGLFFLGIIYPLSTMLIIDGYEVYQRSQHFLQNNELIHFQDFDGENVVPERHYVYRLYEAVDADNQQIIQKQMEIQHNEPVMELMRVQLKNLAQFEPLDEED